jgi:hypothetical protein
MKNITQKLLFPAIHVAHLDGDYRKIQKKIAGEENSIWVSQRKKEDLIDEFNQSRQGLLGKYLAKIKDFGGEERHQIELEKIDEYIEECKIQRGILKLELVDAVNISKEERDFINKFTNKLEVKSTIYREYDTIDEKNILIKELLNKSNILIQFLSRKIALGVSFQSIETNFGKYDIEKEHDGYKMSDRENEIINLIFGENKIRAGFNHNKQVIKSLDNVTSNEFLEQLVIGGSNRFARLLLKLISSIKEIYLKDESYEKYIHDFSELLAQLDETLTILFHGKSYSKFDSLKDEIEKIIDITSAKKIFKKYGIHNYNTSRNVTYCKSCGCTSSKTNKDCSKQKGHDFLVQKVEGIWRPYCKSCGIEGSNIPSNQNCTSRV